MWTFLVHKFFNKKSSRSGAKNETMLIPEVREKLPIIYRTKFTNIWFHLKNEYIDKLIDIVNKYYNMYHGTIKMKLVDVKWRTCFDFRIENNDENTKFNVSDHVKITKHENIFSKGYAPNWEFEIKKTQKHCAVDVCNRRS